MEILYKSKDEILLELDKFCNSLENEDDQNIVLEIMDLVSGWCPPNKDILNDEKYE